ncbi:MAG TPA: DUF4276 family protein [Nostocaceae cyanobacterium]|nr:DUF4276 family protein [Nostocaceae cyanobacterium]
MHIEFLVEEPSAKEALQNLLPKILCEDITFNIHSFWGKDDLFKKLPNRLKGYKSWLPDDDRIIVLVDQDSENCITLKEKLEQIAIDAGFVTKTSTNTSQFQVLTRIAIEELEAWFFGDIEALVKAYPGVSLNLGSKAAYRDPDAILGGTWEALERELKKAGHHQGGLEKLKLAREVSIYMTPAKNRSQSFQVFYTGLLKMIE